MFINAKMPKDSERERSWFMVLNNPEEHIDDCENMTEEEIVNYLADKWMGKNGDNASCAFAYCISADGLKHVHGIGENPNKVSFKVIRELFPGVHLEVTKGTKKQAEDYIYKRGAFAEKGEKIICCKIVGEITGSQGKRSDLDKIADMVHSGMSLLQIQDALGCNYEKYEHIVKGYFFRMQQKDMPRIRNIDVIWHVGVSGSGKSYSYEIDPRGDDEVTLVLASNLSHPGCFDNYIGQKTLYIDEIKPGGITYGKLIELIGGIKNNSICRYSTFVPMWEEVHFTSVYTPMEFYKELVSVDKRKIDTSDQLIGRISKTYLHFVIDKIDCKIVDNPRIRKQTDPENLEYHHIEFIGAPERYTLECAMYSYLQKLKNSNQ